MGRVMHEYEHGELKSGRGGKVKNRKQAVAIALHEAGASKYESEHENEQSLHKTERKEARGETYQQEAEGNSHVGASGERESTPAMGGIDAQHRTTKGRRVARSRARSGDLTYDELYDRAKKAHIEGRSKMTKQQLRNALHH
jgi:hypothetical protein